MFMPLFGGFRSRDLEKTLYIQNDGLFSTLQNQQERKSLQTHLMSVEKTYSSKKPLWEGDNTYSIWLY